LTLKLELMK